MNESHEAGEVGEVYQPTLMSPILAKAKSHII